MLEINLNSPEPLEEQVRRGIHRAIAVGEVNPGDALPSVRQLAGDLGIHWNTVARAYRRLRDEGLLSVGRGRTVTVRQDALAQERVATRPENASALLETAFVQAKLQGLSYRQWSRQVEKQLKQWRGLWET